MFVHFYSSRNIWLGGVGGGGNGWVVKLYNSVLYLGNLGGIFSSFLRHWKLHFSQNTLGTLLHIWVSRYVPYIGKVLNGDTCTNQLIKWTVSREWSQKWGIFCLSSSTPPHKKYRYLLVMGENNSEKKKEANLTHNLCTGKLNKFLILFIFFL